MALFKYIETIFFVSLAITFILILLLVYHFKDRILQLENKLDTLFDIVNNVVKEMMVLKSQCIGYRTQNVFVPSFSTGGSSSQHSSLRVDKIVVSDDEDDVDEDDDEDDEDLNEDIDDEDLNDDMDDEDEEQEEGVFRTQSIEVKEDAIIDSLEIDEFEPSTQEPIVYESIDASAEQVSSVVNSTSSSYSSDLVDSKNYRKMDVPALRTLVLSKGYTIDTSKMKKKDLVQLLSSL